MLAFKISRRNLILLLSLAIGILAVGVLIIYSNLTANANECGDSQSAPFTKFVVAASVPEATKAGCDVLKAGGNAIDAMVAVQTVLGLVEPQSSGLGGGAFLVYWDAEKRKLTTLDGREKAPMAATPKLFQDKEGKPLSFVQAWIGGRSVGVPGTVKLLTTAHKRYGTMAWDKLLQPATELARDGFKVQKRLYDAIEQGSELLKRYPTTSAYFFADNGEPVAAGSILKNPDYANTLQQLATSGDEPFYHGSIADRIVATVHSATDNPGLLEKADMENYNVKERPPVCVNYRGYDVCGMGPPSSGGLTVGQILKLVEPFDLARLGPNNKQSWRIIGDASRLAFADRARYMADVDFVPMPIDGLIATNYLKERSKLLYGDRALPAVSAGEPEWSHAMNLADDNAIEFPSTSHFVIVDGSGNIVSMTTTIEQVFGSHLMVDGFLLNNELTDFSFSSHKNGIPIANRVEPGKRPRSSMSPTIILKKNGKPYIAVGSPGGSRIIGYVAQAIIAMLDWDMEPQQAVNMGHRINRTGIYELEKDTEAVDDFEALKAMGYEIEIKKLHSGLHAAKITADGLVAGTDTRVEGAVMGE